jgi:hypothetical protein
MEYKGVSIAVVQNGRGWRWSLLTGEPAMLRLGEADSEQAAIMEARRVIDRALRVQETIRMLRRG